MSRWLILIVLALTACGQLSGGATPPPPAPTPTPSLQAAALARLGVPAPPDGVPYQPGSFAAQDPGLDNYVGLINSSFIDGMQLQNQELETNEVYVSQQSPAALRAFYEARLKEAGWELFQASDEPGRIRELLLYQRRDTDAGYGLYINLTSNPNNRQDPNTYVFLIVGRSIQ
ncbi:MAG TPA: hypothetical protein VGE07_08390 [Herpetosiphonaceae bacterium]